MDHPVVVPSQQMVELAYSKGCLDAGPSNDFISVACVIQLSST